MIRKVWVLVANSTKAIIYKAEDNHLHVHYVMNHPEGHLPKHELASDRQGQTFYGSQADSMEDRTPLKEKEARLFATEISHYLESNLNEKTFERLYVIAKPPFLGFLRHSLTLNLTKIVEAEIHKDLVLLQPEEIREHLPPSL